MRRHIFGWLLWLVPLGAIGAEAASSAAIDEVVVSSSRPGPGLWRVSKDGRELWVLGTVSPVLRKLQWDASLVEGVIDDAGAVLLTPRVDFDFDIGFFGGMMLIPSALGARNNPDKAKLRDVLPPPDYARFSTLKQQYMPRNRSIEKRRPFVAARDLYENAIKDVGLQYENITVKVINRAAKRNKIKPTEPKLEVTLKDPKAALKELKSSTLDDLQCLQQTMSFIEKDLDAAKARAAAWAEGDIAALKNLPLTDRRTACAGALLNSDLMRKRGFDDLPARLRAVWLDAAEKALSEHDVSFAAIPMQEVLSADGYLAALEKRGYLVEAPGE
jgi:uncharacterized protein YbaP (TraB family)